MYHTTFMNNIKAQKEGKNPSKPFFLQVDLGPTLDRTWTQTQGSGPGPPFPWTSSEVQVQVQEIYPGPGPALTLDSLLVLRCTLCISECL